MRIEFSKNTQQSLSFKKEAGDIIVRKTKQKSWFRQTQKRQCTWIPNNYVVLEGFVCFPGQNKWNFAEMSAICARDGFPRAFDLLSEVPSWSFLFFSRKSRSLPSVSIISSIFSSQSGLMLWPSFFIAMAMSPTLSWPSPFLSNWLKASFAAAKQFQA